MKIAKMGLLISICLGLVFLVGGISGQRWGLDDRAVAAPVEIKACDCPCPQTAEGESKYSLSDEEIMSAYEALLYIDAAIYAHQYYIDHPELQNAGTGDTALNTKTIKQYQRLRRLIEGLIIP